MEFEKQLRSSIIPTSPSFRANQEDKRDWQQTAAVPPLAFGEGRSEALYAMLRRNVADRPEEAFLVTDRKTYSYRQVHNLVSHLCTHCLDKSNRTEVVSLNIQTPEVLFLWIWACLAGNRSFVLLPAMGDFDAVRTYMRLAGSTVLVSDLDPLPALAIDADITALVPEEAPIECTGTTGEATVSFLSSGTSGAAKLIRVSYTQIADALTCIAREDRMPYTHHQHGFITPSLSHSYGFSSMLEYTLGGSTIILPAERNFIGLMKSLMSKRLKNCITAIEGVAYFYQQLKPLLPRLDLPNLRHIGFGGDFMEHSFVAEVRKRYPDLSYSVRYGLSEIPSAISVKVHQPPYHTNWESAGKVMSLYQVQITDTEGNPLPEGQEGEIVVYYAHPGNEARKSERIATGDVGLRENQELVIKGRKQFFIKCKGYKIYPAFVENGVKASGLVEDVRATGEHNKLKIEIVPNHNYRDKNQLLDFLAQQLPDYVVPDTIELTTAITRNGAGKIIRTG